MGTYEYDLWGNPVTIEATTDDTIGITEKNPLRYRGYYYDRETKFYYLNARYYDPDIHRFISPEPNAKLGKFDKNTGINAYNLFAYCGNDPINLRDQTGEFAIATMIVVGVCAAIGMAIGGIIGDAVATNKGYKGWDKICTVLTYMGVGGLIGGVLGLAAPYLASMLGTGLELAAAGLYSLGKVKRNALA